MSDTVFVLGAGASKAAGAPLMADFLDVAYSLWKKGQVVQLEDHFARVFRAISALQAVHSKSQLDMDNIESVFATLEMAHTLGKFPGVTPEDTTRTLESLKVVIGATIERTLRIPVSSQLPYPPDPYLDFSSLIEHLMEDAFPKHTVSVITFNYDLACDFALHYSSLSVDYALEDSNGSGRVPLLKLHGSLNWAYCPDLQRVVPWTVEEFFKSHTFNPIFLDRSFVSLQITPHLKNFTYRGASVQPEPVLVPPTWNKTEHHRNISVVWKRAAKELTDAENIFIIGYSLPETDAFFRYLYALGTVGDIPLKRVWVFNPDVSVEPRFSTMLGPAARSRFRFFELTFEQALDIITDEFPTRKDQNR